MTDVPANLPDANEADALDQAQAADGLDESYDELHAAATLDGGAARWDANEADVVEQAIIVRPAGDEEHGEIDER